MTEHLTTKQGQLKRIDELKRICLSINEEINTVSEEANDFDKFAEVCGYAKTLIAYMKEYHDICGRQFDPNKLIDQS